MYSDYWKDRVSRYNEQVKDLKMKRDMMPPSPEREAVKKKLEQALVDKKHIEDFLANEAN